MSYLNDAQATLWQSIIGYVESNNDYSAFAGAGANTSNETAITIGCYQFYGTYAKKLLNRIRTDYPTQFKKLDTAGIGDDLDNEDWSKYAVTKTSDKGKCIISIISSSAGKKTQDTLFNEIMETYYPTIQTKGVTDTQAVLMCANWIWQGSTSAFTRILAKTTAPYNLENLYAACCTDTKEGQVGTYKARQKYVYEHLRDDWAGVSGTTTSSSSTTTSTNTESAATTSTSSSSGTLSKTVQYTGYARMKMIPRTWAGLDASAMTKVTSVAKNAAVSVCDSIKDSDGYTWLYCKIGSYYGFLPESGISKTKIGSGYNKTAVWNGKVSTSGGTLNLRKGPGTTYAQLSSYPSVKNGTALQICDSTTDSSGSTWYYILYKQKYGFASAKYITLTAAC